MNTAVKLGGFAAGLAVLFGASLGAGKLVGPSPTEPSPAAHGDAGHGATGHDEVSEVELPGGLQVAQDGYRLVPVSGALATDSARAFEFRVTGPDGRVVTAYRESHEKKLHLIVVRRDLTGFQHLHPTMSPDGVWSAPIKVDSAGQYRVFADFQPEGRDKGLVLGVDMPAAGDYRPVTLPGTERTAQVDGYTVTLDGDLKPGTASKLTLTVSKDGKPVTDLQPYLGAFGHLVALRDGDLAYLHVHPSDGPAGPHIEFLAEVPSSGSYKLFLDFKHGDKVRTASFTVREG